MALFGHLMWFFFLSAPFFFKVHMQCSLWRNATGSLHTEGRDCFLGAMAWWQDYLFLLVFSLLNRNGFILLHVSVPQFSALQKPLPLMIDLLSCLRMFFKYCRQQEADSKALLYRLGGISWSIILTICHPSLQLQIPILILSRVFMFLSFF